MPVAVGSFSQRRIMIRANYWVPVLAGCLWGISPDTGADDALAILPPQVTLASPASSQQLLVQRRVDEHLAGPVTAAVQWASSDPAVALVDSRGVVTPAANGQTTITATVGENNVSVPVTVVHLDREFQWGFRNHVLPVFTKAGCNRGACHGALAGKGGFRLSLRGYDPETDHFTITKQDRGRRVEFGDAGRSLVLAKPAGAIPHKGGLRLNPETRDYTIVSEWIAAGAAPPSATDPQMESITLYPERVELHPGDVQQLVTVASYPDRAREDVTGWTTWTSTNEAVCRVDETGRVSIIGPGEGAVMAWFSQQIAIARISVPYSNAVDESLFAQLAPRNFIDEQINAQLQRLNLPPAPRCDDATFLRRAFLDTIGTLPTPEEVRDFLAKTSPEKRDQLIEALLEREEFVDYWSYKWSDVLMLNGTLLRPEALKAYYNWIHAHVEQNTPWDEFVREILTATGDSFIEGETNFYALYETPEEMTENACQSFLGLSIACAKCHNHPLEKWTNDQYYAMANLFSRVRGKGWGGDRRGGDGRRTTFVIDSGELIQPRTGKPQPPTPLDGEPVPFDDPQDRRVHLAAWLTSPENPYFARAVTNRIWANFMGVGLVESVDDMRTSNPASNDELLEAASQYLIDEKFNLKALMREILISDAYQRSSIPLPENEADERFYSRYFPRRLNAEVLHDAIVQVSKVPTNFDFVAFPGADRQKTDFYPLGTRAIQLYDSSVEAYFLKTFGRNSRNIVCECERSNEPSMVQVLHLSNGETVNEKLAASESRAASATVQLENGMSPEALVDDAYLACLARYPRPQERTRFVQILNESSAAERRTVVEDLYWALMTSREFVFNH